MNRWVEVLRFSGIGFYIAGCIVLGVALGVWLDRKVDLSPLLTLLGLGFGLFLAFVGTYRMLLSALGDRWGKRKGGS
ncbi:MAG: AtpZ/AtpI family protein [Dehalococcoidia bacterium]|nr:AtpZ/AtpI family protein [Dehalococcoidia bacterium]